MLLHTDLRLDNNINNALSISLSRLHGRTYKYPTQRTVHLARMPSHVNTMHGVEP